MTSLSHSWIPGCGTLLSTDASCQPILQMQQVASITSELPVTSGNHTKTRLLVDRAHRRFRLGELSGSL